MEKIFNLLERLAVVAEKIGKLCDYVVEKDNKEHGEMTDTEEPGAVQTEKELDKALYDASELSRTSLLQKCAEAGIPIKNPNSTKDKRTETLRKEYAAYVNTPDTAREVLPSQTQASPAETKKTVTREEVLLALQEVQRKEGNAEVLAIMKKVMGKPTTLSGIPEDRYADVIKEVNKL